MIILRELGYAKINLYLHITGKRPDEYHLLDSLVAFADVHDKIEVIPSDTITLAIEGQYALQISEKDNIVLKAAELLQKRFNVAAGAGLTLHKNLPVGAGIGGGSADAAAALKLLARFWRIKPAAQDYYAIALALGADVHACLRSSTVYTGGIGEIIEPGPVLSGYHIVLVNPGKPLLSKDVYAKYDGHFSAASRHPHAFPGVEECVEFLLKAKNDLQKAATAMLPEIATVIQALGEEKECMIARMSGSGPTCFGIFTDAHAAGEAATNIGAQHPDWWIKATTIR